MPAIAAGGGGGLIGYLAGRRVAPTAANALQPLVEAVIRQSALSTGGALIATGLAAASAVIAALTVPLVVIWSLSRKENKQCPNQTSKP